MPELVIPGRVSRRLVPALNLPGYAHSANDVLAAGTTWPVANDALFLPFVVYDQQQVVTRLAFNIGVQSGNYDAGIYTLGGARIVSKGSTATPAAGFNYSDIADTTLQRGTYLLALAFDNIVVQPGQVAGMGGLGHVVLLGVRKMATAFPLPATATLATPTSTLVPGILAEVQ